MTGNVHAIKEEVSPVHNGFVETPSAKAMLTALRRARARSRLTMIAGAPGTGKSETMWKFKTEVPNAIIAVVVRLESGAWHLADQLCRVLELPSPNSRNMPETRRMIAEAVGEGGFLMIDEAQNLVQDNPRGPDNWRAMEWVRGMAEEGGLGVAFIGDQRLLESLKSFPQLRRRTHPRVILRCTTPDDVALFCGARGLTDTKAIKCLTRTAQRFGGLGDIAETITTAMDMVNGAQPTVADIQATLELLDLNADRVGATANA